MRILAIVLALMFSSAAFGQTGELWFNFGESELANNGIGTPLAIGGTSSDYSLASDWRFSFRFDFNQGEHFGHEIQYAYNRTALKDNIAGSCAVSSSAASLTGVPTCSTGMAFHQGGYNFLYYILTKSGAKIRPFATGGFQFDDFVPPGASAEYGGGSNKFGGNFGAGVKIHLHGIWAARLDAREYVTGKPSFGFALNSGALWQTEISAGVGIGF